MAERTRRHPDLILVQVYESEGFGFTFLADEDFTYAADHFLLPAVKYASLDPNDPEQRRTVAYDFLWRYFNKPQAKGYFRENVRWIAAATVREKFADEAKQGRMPRVVLIARKSGEGIAIRNAEEYLSHPGYPLALIVGHPRAGGGPAHFFSSQAQPRMDCPYRYAFIFSQNFGCRTFAPGKKGVIAPDKIVGRGSDTHR